MDHDAAPHARPPAHALDDDAPALAASADDLSRPEPSLHARRLFAEAVGTCLVVVVDAGGAMAAAMSPGDISPTVRAAATGRFMMAAVYAISSTSGAHFNPAITFAFAMRRAFPWRLVPGYWLAQTVGAIVGAVGLRLVLGDVDHLGATHGHFGPWRAFATEATFTAIRVIVVLGTAVRHKIVGANAAIATGASVALTALIVRPLSGASANPARSLGPALVASDVGDLWIYLLAPLVGALLGNAVTAILHVRQHGGVKEAAEGH